MSNNHIFTSELSYYQPLEVWAKKNLSEEEFKEFEINMRDQNLELISKIYENWIIDQKLTHEYTDIYGDTVVVSHLSLNKN